MRPINKGESPKEYTRYRYSVDDLKERLGSFCSYCEMNIDNQPDVEHVIPKSKEPDLKLKWSNFLLSCKTCNTIKGDKNDDREGYAFPDEVNTAYLYRYQHGMVQINDELSEEDKEKAQKMFDLIKVDRDRNTSNLNDDRKIARLREFNKATDSLKDYSELPCDLMASVIGRSPSGFVSVWLEVFKEHPKVKEAILKNTKGTALKCYDDNFTPIKDINRGE